MIRTDCARSLRKVLKEEMTTTKVNSAVARGHKPAWKRINLFLYRVTPNAFSNNRDWLPAWRARANWYRADRGQPLLPAHGLHAAT